jgi:enoyl-[acyl-carrier-protein] reductase (NADH)
MTSHEIPNLKRFNISSDQELDALLAKLTDCAEKVMVVTHCVSSHPKHVSRKQVHDALVRHGWKSGQIYTLNASLIGHVISRKSPKT